MRITQDEMIQIAIVMEFHLDWPGYRTTDLPVLPDGWCWVGKGGWRAILDGYWLPMA